MISQRKIEKNQKLELEEEYASNSINSLLNELTKGKTNSELNSFGWESKKQTSLAILKEKKRLIMGAQRAQKPLTKPRLNSCHENPSSSTPRTDSEKNYQSDFSTEENPWKSIPRSPVHQDAKGLVPRKEGDMNLERIIEEKDKILGQLKEESGMTDLQFKKISKKIDAKFRQMFELNYSDKVDSELNSSFLTETSNDSSSISYSGSISSSVLDSSVEIA